MTATARRRKASTDKASEYAYLLQRFLALAPEPAGCRACTDTPCPVHRLRRDVEAALRPEDAPAASGQVS